MSQIRVIKDRLSVRSALKNPSTLNRNRSIVPSGKQFRTKIEVTNELGEVVFRTENITVIGGTTYALEKMFNVQSSLKIATLNDIMGIANDGPAIPTTPPYPAEHRVCLFGVGLGGAGESYTSVYPDKFVERTVPDMIPLRLTENALDSAEQEQYWFRKTENGKTAYYLKTFENTPTIKHLWRDNVNANGEYEDGSEVEANPHESTRDEGIDTFIEFIIKINRKDCREYFTETGNIDAARVNSFGIFSGVKGTLANGTTDYKGVKLIAKFNIPNDVLYNSKELAMSYRIYTS